MSKYTFIQGTTFTSVGIAILAGASAAYGTVTYDQDLVSPDNTNSPGWYDGTGNPNGGFTVDNENGIELGLRAKLRQSPTVIDSPTDLYVVPAGQQPSSPGHAAWNYEFSIDLAPLGVSSGYTLGDIANSTSLTITNVTTSATATVNPLTYWGDDSGFGITGKTTPENATEWGAQQSENPMFADFPLAAGYDPNAPDLYRFDLTIDNPTGPGVLASDTMFVSVPEPASFSLIGVGALALLKRRRQA